MTKAVLRKFLVEVQQGRNLAGFFDRVVASVPTHEVCRVLVSSRDPRIQVILCNVLRKQRRATAIPALLSLLKQTKDSKVRVATIEALGDLKAKSAGARILALFKDKRQPVYVRDTAALALGLIKYQRAEPQLIKGLRARQGTIRGCSAKSLAFIKSQVGLPALSAQFVQERDPNLKEIIKFALLTILRNS